MDHDRAHPALSDSGEQRRRRRAVMIDVRRKVERDWVLAPAAEDLAREVESILKMIDSRATGLDPAELAPLRAALAEFGRLQGGPPAV